MTTNPNSVAVDFASILSDSGGVEHFVYLEVKEGHGALTGMTTATARRVARDLLAAADEVDRLSEAGGSVGS